jgi:hypothetical protein
MVCTDIVEDRKAIELLDVKQFSIDPLPGLAHYRVGHSKSQIKIFSGAVAVQCFKFDEIFEISTKVWHYLLYSELVFRLNKPFYQLCGPILALDGM